MKIDELLKRLENFEIKNEKREIAEYLAQTFSDKKRRYIFYIMMKDKTIYGIDAYGELLEFNKVLPDYAYVFIENDYSIGYDLTSYFYPFLVYKYLLLYAYLSKLGFETDFRSVVPAPGLKYVAIVNNFSDVDRIVVEVADIDNAAINTNLQTLVHGVLSTKHDAKYMTYNEVEGIISRFISQKLFAGYDFREAKAIIYKYYNDHDTSLAKEVEAIRGEYNRIFRPYRIECKRLQSHISIIS